MKSNWNRGSNGIAIAFDVKVKLFYRAIKALGCRFDNSYICLVRNYQCNIIKGEMSFVGPRPCVPYEYEKFKPEHRTRFNAVPGLTGLWQVSGKNNTTFQQMIDMDIAYSQKLSMWSDVGILFRTFPVLFQQVIQMMRKKRARLTNHHNNSSSGSNNSRVGIQQLRST